MNQREKDLEHFKHIPGPPDRAAADGAEYGRKDLARRLLDTPQGVYAEPIPSWAQAICQAILQGDGSPAPAAPEPDEGDPMQRSTWT